MPSTVAAERCACVVLAEENWAPLTKSQLTRGITHPLPIKQPTSHSCMICSGLCVLGKYMLLTLKVALGLRTVAIMPSPKPVILCGKTEAIGAVVIENLKPEFEGAEASASFRYLVLTSA
jgi:hypothetical protein